MSNTPIRKEHLMTLTPAQLAHIIHDPTVTTLPRIVIYSRNPRVCMQCKMTKKRFDRFGIPYSTYDVDTDDIAYTYVTDVLGVTSIPVVVVTGIWDEPTMWTGFSPDLIQTVATQYPQKIADLYAQGIITDDEDLDTPANAEQADQWLRDAQRIDELIAAHDEFAHIRAHLAEANSWDDLHNNLRELSDEQRYYLDHDIDSTPTVPSTAR